MPVRLLAAVIGGMLLLGEPLRNALEAFGLLALVAIVVAYIRVNSQIDSRQQALATQGEGPAYDEDEGGDRGGEQRYLPVDTSSVRGFSDGEEPPPA
jgi:hypothetical protein